MTPYEPKPYEIAGVDLIGYRQPDGKIQLGSSPKNGTLLDDFPKSILVQGVVYTLEFIKKNDGEPGHLPANHPGKNIEWGIYV